MNGLLFTIVLLVALATGANAQQTTLAVTNPTDYQRQEVVEADLQAVYNRLGLTAGETFVIKNGFGQEQAYQLSYDGKLLMYVSVLTHSQAEFTIAKGQPAAMKPHVFGRRLERGRGNQLGPEDGVGRELGCSVPDAAEVRVNRV